MEGYAVRRTLTVLILVLALLLTACGKPAQVADPQPDPTPSPTPAVQQTDFTLPYYPGASLHPITGSNRANLILSNLVYQGLFELDNSFSAHGVLCSQFSVSEDGLVWTFTLGSHVFSDGSPVTADDVVRSLEQAAGSALYAGRLANVQSIRATEDGCVALTLFRPNSALPALLDIPIIRDREDGSMPLGTGAYTFVEDDGPLRLARRATAPETLPAEIPLFPIESADDLIYAFDAGTVSMVVSDLTGANTLGYSSGYEVFSYPTTTMLYVGFQAKSGPCKNPLVRRAVSRSFDRSTVTDSLLAGHGVATCLPVSPHCELYNPTCEEAGSFSTLAEELFAQTGYAAGDDGLLYSGRVPLSLTFIVNTDNSFKLTVAEYLTRQLTDLGITVRLQKLAWDDYLTALERGTFDLYLGEVTLTADFDLTALLAADGHLNYGGYTNPETDALLAQLREVDESGRRAASDALLEQFLADAPLAPLCFKNHAVLTQWRSVSGLTPTRQNPFYDLESLRFRAVK